MLQFLTTTDCPIFPWSPLTEISSFGGGGGGQTSEASGAVGVAVAPALQLASHPLEFLVPPSKRSAGFWAHDE